MGSVLVALFLIYLVLKLQEHKAEKAEMKPALPEPNGNAGLSPDAILAKARAIITERAKTQECVRAGLCPRCGGKLHDDGEENLITLKCGSCYSLYWG